MRVARFIRLAIILVLLGALAPFTAAPTGAQETVTAIVELQRAPVGPAAARAERAGAAFDADAYKSQLLQEQQAFLDHLDALGIEASVETVETEINDSTSQTIRAQLTYVLNAVAINVHPDAISTIASLPEVKAVHPNEEVQALLDTSVDYINAPQVWNELGAEGEGKSIAVIDTGIDWTHPMFGGDVGPPGETHPKVKFYMTFTAGGPDGHGHGTHVGGIAAGDKDYGQTTTGPALFDGVAPKADLWGYKVLSDAGTGSSLSVILGIEDAASRGADVINLSLGSTSGDPNSPSALAVNNASAAGVAVAVAAGNSGPGYSTIGSPASAHDAITFGASTDPGDNAYFARLQVDPVESKEIIPLSNSPIPAESIQARYFDCGKAITTAECAGAAGKIALIERGDVTFTQKAANAEAAGAIAAVIYNNVPGNFAGTLIVLSPTIPVVAMSQADGQRLMEFVGDDKVSTVDLTLDFADPAVLAGQVAGFSSRGPNDDYVIKPDVVAPGNNITSSVPPVGQLASPDRYGDAGGTSMASPHGAGALALLREVHPDWTPEELKTALMNSAVQLVDPADGTLYSVHDQGAGLIDVYAAAKTPALIGETKEDGRLARGSVNFGLVQTYGGEVKVSKSLLVQDVSGQGGTWELSWQPGNGKERGGKGRSLPANGFSLKVKPDSVSVEAGATKTVAVELNLDGSQLAEGDYEGRIVATNGSTTLRVPVAVTVANGNTYGTNAPDLKDPGDTNTTGNYKLEWTAVEDAQKYRLQEASAASLLQHLADDAEGDLEATWDSSGWTHSSMRSHSGTSSFFSGQGPEQNSTLTTKAPISLPADSGVTLSYWTYFDIEDGFDFGYVEVSDDGGASWEVAGQVNGWSEGWVKRSVDLSRYAGKNVLVRFRYDSDLLIDLGLYEGWYIDDISIESAKWTTVAESGATEHAVSDKPSGTYFYRVSGLFNVKGFGKQLHGPWSDTVDIVVQR